MHSLWNYLELNVKYWMTDGMPSPRAKGETAFTHTVDLKPGVCSRRRLEGYQNFFGSGFEPKHALDVGGEGWISQEIERIYGVKLDRTLETNFNDVIQVPNPPYDTIFCFEVLEHVMGPYGLMKALHSYLKPSGNLYFSTPRLPIISIYQADLHFTEYKLSKLSTLFKETGFQIQQAGLINPFPWWTFLTGPKSLVRHALHRHYFFHLKPAP